MEEKPDLTKYLSNGIENLIRSALRASFRNPREAGYLSQYALSAARQRKIREKHESEGLHIPAFLIASVASSCNLSCAGCYARANECCGDTEADDRLSVSEWREVFVQAQELGIGIILLAGGEPLLRRDVIEEASRHPDMLFPIFTNGTLLDDTYINLFNAHRCLVPLVSVEGDEQMTDARRGSGVYRRLSSAMDQMLSKGIFYGVSVTLTKMNLEYATGEAFLDQLRASGCRVVVYVEYVPAAPGTEYITLSDMDRAVLEERLGVLRRADDAMLFISFPGDEGLYGGCLAAGRGFFHINPRGGAEPCPFSPFSDANVRDMTLKKALESSLFRKLKDGELLREEHTGGCALFGKEEEVRHLLNN